MRNRRGRRPTSGLRLPDRSPRAATLLLRRVTRWATRDLAREEAAAVRRLVSDWPAWAAWWGYTLGYVEGAEAGRAEALLPPDRDRPPTPSTAAVPPDAGVPPMAGGAARRGHHRGQAAG